MDDMERYGDYNEIDTPPGKSPVLRVIKIVAVVLIFAIIGFVGFRIFTINYYPDSVKTLYFSDALTEYYNEKNGNITVYTQKLYAPYDDEKEGNFFCDHLRFVREAGTLQITMRFNISVEETLEQKYGTELDLENHEAFDFTLWRSGDGATVGRLVSAEWDSFLMYRYVRLVFEDVDFSVLDNTDKDNWLSLQLTVDGVQEKNKETGEKTDKLFRILVYENQEKYTGFKVYNLSSSEVPK